MSLSCLGDKKNGHMEKKQLRGVANGVLEWERLIRMRERKRRGKKIPSGDLIQQRNKMAQTPKSEIGSLEENLR